MEDEEAQFHQMMLERQQMLEEAIERAESGKATVLDWAIIRFECGLPSKQTRSE